MGITQDGIRGEQKLFRLLRDKGFKFFQPDAVGKKNGNKLGRSTGTPEGIMGQGERVIITH